MSLTRALYTTCLSFAAILSLSGCSTNPVTGNNEFSLVSAQDEVAIGQQNYAPYQQQQGGRYVVDAELNLYVNQVGQALAKVSDRSGLPYEFVVLNSDVPNAWALPGGKIAINRGLLVLLDDEAQLAAVLAHEIVHAAARHGALQMTQQQMLGLGVLAAGVASSQNEYSEYIGLAAMGGASLYHARYGRQQELESDNYGIDYMVRAGYDPQAAVELQETFVKLSEGQRADLFSELFASHPPSQLRVNRNREKASKLGKGKRNRAQYQQAIAQIKQDKAAYKAHQEALKAAGEQNMKLAQSKLNQAIKAQPDEALFYITRGQFELKEDNFKGAETSFRKAYNRNPDYFMSSLGLGVAQKARKQFKSAKPNLEKSLRILPTPIAMFHLGEIAEHNGDRQQAIAHYQQVARAGGTLGNEATQKLNNLGYSVPNTGTSASTGSK